MEFPSARYHGAAQWPSVSTSFQDQKSKLRAMRIEDGLGKFLLQLEADGRSPHTIAQYRRHVRLLARWAADVGHTGDLREISPEDIARFLGSPVARTRPDGGGKRATTVNVLRSSLKGFFGYLDRAGYLTQDPTRLLRRALAGSGPPTTLSDDEERRLLLALACARGPEGRRDSAMFHLMLAAGLRVGSVVALDVDDLDLERGEVFLRTMKGDQPERVFLSGAIRDHLRRYVADRRARVLFPGQGGRRLTTRHVHRRFSGWLAEAGIRRRLSPHSLRHSFASKLYRKTGDILLVRDALRHRSLASTLVYARTDEERLRRALG